MKSYIAYGVSIIVIVASASLVIFLPINNDIKAVFSLPGIAGLFSLLVQGWRDQIAYERQAELQRNQQDFDLAIASHMANVVFDKQVDFCEKYSQKLRSIVQEMFKDGPSDKTISYSQELRDIRNEYAPWISKELTQKIKPFESALNEIASLEVLQKLNPNDPSRYSTIDRMFKIYAKLLGISMEGLPEEPESAADVVLEYFSDVLGVFDLELLRRAAISLAKDQQWK